MLSSAKSSEPKSGSDSLSRYNTFFPIALAFFFLMLVAYFIHALFDDLEYGLILVVAAVFGGYMALNIGANDVANNLAPAVGAKAITLAVALFIAAIFETAGALIAGGDVVETVSKGIINPAILENQRDFILLMMSALLAAALWLNLATYLGAPVSTTHSIVGAVMGGGVAASGLSIINGAIMSKIVASWVMSPVLGGLVAAVFYWAVLRLVMEKEDKLRSSRRWVPVFIGIMASAFTMYLMIKGLKKVVAVEPATVAITGLVVLVVSPFVIRPAVERSSRKLANTKNDVQKLFTYPLVCSAALLSFAHGANDVANAVGPLAAIASGLGHTDAMPASKIGIPLWVMLLGAIGLSVGLILFGGKMVNAVGQAITKLDHVRSYCVSLSAAVTVIIASSLGLPVSSTHITVGAIFGIGLYREWNDFHARCRRCKKSKIEYERHMIKRKLVRRRHLLSILAAWVITVPCSFFIAAAIYLGLHCSLPRFM